MKNKKGFTLVEVLAIIAVLGVMVMLIFPNIGGTMSSKKEKELEKLIGIAESAGKAYFSFNDDVYKINLDTLKNDKYITADMTDPNTGELLDGCVRKILNNEDVFEYHYGDCETIEVPLIVELNGGTPSQTINEKYEEGTKIELINPTKENADFKGWEIVRGNSILKGNTLRIGTTETEIWALWESYSSLEVDLDGGTDNVEYAEFYKSSTIIELEIPTKTGYTFEGWELIEGNGIISGNTLTMGSEDTKIKATWKLVVYGADFITKLLAEESTQHNGLVRTYATVNGEQVDAGIRYAGATADVKNKVYFNCAETDGTNAYGSENYNYASSCEVWRIIGVFDTKSTDSETEDAVPRIKIVRDAVLDTRMEWDTTADGVDYINQWGETTLVDDTTPYNGASLKQYLNGDYYNSLTSIAKGQIGNALWYTGAVLDDTASGVYEYERSDATGTGTTVNYTTKWAGLIGLIYTSDFGYAGTNCGSYTIFDYDNASSCGTTSNWLTPSSGDYWTISPDASDSDAWLVSSGGYAAHADLVRDADGVRPAAYLSSNVQIIGGDGSTVPYKLKS